MVKKKHFSIFYNFNVVSKISFESIFIFKIAITDAIMMIVSETADAIKLGCTIFIIK
jgi:hypothetical protein